MRKPDKSTLMAMKALAGNKRFQIMEWLKNPTRHFPKQEDGDLEADGVCVGFIADKLGVAQPTATAHLKILEDAGLVTSKKIKQWTFYRRDGKRISSLIAALTDN